MKSEEESESSLALFLGTSLYASLCHLGNLDFTSNYFLPLLMLLFSSFFLSSFSPYFSFSSIFPRFLSSLFFYPLSSFCIHHSISSLFLFPTLLPLSLFLPYFHPLLCPLHSFPLLTLSSFLPLSCSLSPLSPPLLSLTISSMTYIKSYYFILF